MTVSRPSIVVSIGKPAESIEVDSHQLKISIMTSKITDWLEFALKMKNHYEYVKVNNGIWEVTDC